MRTARDLAGRTVATALTSLADRRPIFHSEADFQLALAWEIQTAYPDARIRLEQRILGSPRINLDVLVTIDNIRLGLELKYLRAKTDVTVDGERFALAVGAPDLDRYDTIKDIVRLERLVGEGLINAGAAIVLSNNPAFWNPGGGRLTGYDQYRLHEGAMLTGTLHWGQSAGAGTRKGRETPHALRGTYPLHWCAFSDLGAPAGTLRSLTVLVG